MLTVASIDLKIAKLQQQRSELVVKERVEVIKRIKAAILQYGIGAEELTITTDEAALIQYGAQKKPSPLKGRKAVPYTRPEGCIHGMTYKVGDKVWNGHGRAPRWLLDHLWETKKSITAFATTAKKVAA